MRPDYLGFMFLTSAVVSFNAGIWQLVRRSEKKRLLENHKNLTKPPVHEIPADDNKVGEFEFLPVELEGMLDNEGSVLVGPRSIPSYKGVSTADESKGGFLVMTPFEIAGTHQFIMVNRGWVPIDAGKHRTLLMQYIGEGFAPMKLRGIFRREEFMSGSFFGGKSPLNEEPLAQDLSWMALRPWNMALDYYKRRWGPTAVDESVSQHGLHHYYVEMLEDYSGDDQRIVRGHAWPWRRGMDEVTYVHLLPIVHSMYVVFWFSVSLGSLYGMSRCYKRQKELFALRKRMTVQSMLLEKKRQEQAQSYLQAMQEVERLKKLGTASTAAQLGIQHKFDEEKEVKP